MCIQNGVNGGVCVAALRAEIDALLRANNLQTGQIGEIFQNVSDIRENLVAYMQEKIVEIESKSKSDNQKLRNDLALVSSDLGKVAEDAKCGRSCYIGEYVSVPCGPNQKVPHRPVLQIYMPLKSTAQASEHSLQMSRTITLIHN